MRTAAHSGLRGIHVLWTMLAFFGAIIAINGAFVVAALDTFPGEDVRRSYLQGLKFNETLAERRAQAALGWHATAEIASEGGRPALIVHVTDRAGAGVNSLAWTGALRRPVDARQDHALEFVRIGDGLYRANLDQLPAGAWDLRARAAHDDATFEITRRFMWRPPAQH